MWSAILNVGGWAFFYLFIIFYVRWVCLEHMYFADTDPEGRVFHSPSGESPPAQRAPEPTVAFPFLSSLGRPA